jgi:hypothetical protein
MPGQNALVNSESRLYFLVNELSGLVFIINCVKMNSELIDYKLRMDENNKEKIDEI